jgi:flagellin
MVISASTNTTANTALRYLAQNSAASSNSLAKLSSGSRIVKASDDAASLAIGTKIKSDVTALKQAQVNTSQASSVLQVADGALAQTTDILMRMKALAVQAQSGSVSDTERGFLNSEYTALSSQIDAIADQTKFNGETLIDGSFKAGTKDMDFQVGVSAADKITVNFNSMKAADLTDGTTTIAASKIDTAANAVLASDSIDGAIAQLNTERANTGALISRFEFAGANVANTIENLQAAQSTLLDVDMAAEMSNFSSKQVMLQASVAMLAQANQQPQQLLRLLN